MVEAPLPEGGDCALLAGRETPLIGGGKAGVIKAERVPDQNAGIEIRCFDAHGAKRGGQLAARRGDGVRLRSRGIGARHQLIPSAASNSA